MLVARAVLAASVVLLASCAPETDDDWKDDGPPPERSPEGTVVLPELLALAPENGHWVDAACSREDPTQACIVVAERTVDYSSALKCGPPGKISYCVRLLTDAESEREGAFREQIAHIAQQYRERLLQRGWTHLNYADGTSDASLPLRQQVDGKSRCVLLYDSERQYPSFGGRALGVVALSDVSAQAYCAAGVLPGSRITEF